MLRDIELHCVIQEKSRIYSHLESESSLTIDAIAIDRAMDDDGCGRRGKALSAAARNFLAWLSI
ncbi:hypothetical protein WBP06_17195 [Novosphingobium sp. BL-8H]|uniref:hypothetical protein n=1 Tax=Novosphingobium sp. BL-8H TaxID=3127640 RepID=UPI0037564947